MGDLSPNFSLWETKCKCGCGAGGIDPILLDFNERVRAALGDRRTTWTSVTRCKAHNTKVGGVDWSSHLFGKASDEQVEGATPAEVFAVAEAVAEEMEIELAHVGTPRIFGIGLYKTFCHFDVREKQAGKQPRWISFGEGHINFPKGERAKLWRRYFVALEIDKRKEAKT